MKWSEAQAAFEDAERAMRIADEHATAMAKLLKGRLRKVESGYTLAALKKELSRFNCNTKTWKEDT